LLGEVDVEFAKLQEFVGSQSGGVLPLANYDIEYWKNKHTQLKYNIPQNETSNWFSLDSVLNGIFTFTHKVFNIQFKLNTKYDKKKLWNSNVLVYDVLNDKNEQISTLLIDPFKRPGKNNSIWSYSGHDCSSSTNAKPLAYLNLNINEKDTSIQSFDQIKQIFTEFGNVLQILTTDTPFTQLSDRNSIEFDSFYLTPMLFEKFLFQPEVMKLISSNKSNGSSLTDNLFQTYKSRESNFKLMSLMKQAYLSSFDIECHRK
jgi:oligopeptidase A